MRGIGTPVSVKPPSGPNPLPKPRLFRPGRSITSLNMTSPIPAGELPRIPARIPRFSETFPPGKWGVRETWYNRVFYGSGFFQGNTGIFVRGVRKTPWWHPARSRNTYSCFPGQSNIAKCDLPDSRLRTWDYSTPDSAFFTNYDLWNLGGEGNEVQPGLLRAPLKT